MYTQLCSVCDCFSFLCFTPIVSAEGEAKGQTDPEKVLHNFGQVQPAADVSLHNGALVLCNPGASSIVDADPQDTESQAKVFQEAKAPEDTIDGEGGSSVAHLRQRGYLIFMSLLRKELSYKHNQSEVTWSPVVKGPSL